MKSEAKGWFLLPPKPDVCQCCAVDHPPDMPHNQQSLYWQYWFYGTNGRWPTWNDAMAHCTPEMQDKWRITLKEHGVDLCSPTK